MKRRGENPSFSFEKENLSKKKSLKTGYGNHLKEDNHILI